MMNRNKIFIAGILTAVLAVGIHGREKLPTIKQDNKTLDRSGKVFTSFAPVIKDVRQSVVSIETQEKVQFTSSRQSSPFNDPIFREFFGDPYGGRGGYPNQGVQKGLGSGIIVSPDGFILTNNHVIDSADKVQVELSSGKQYDAEVVGRDPATDIAVLKIDALDLPSITFTNSDHIEVGDIVMAIGNPLGVGQTVTMGIVGATGRSDLQDLKIDYQSFIQTDAAINRGNSGGALVDAYGRLVGLNTAIASPSGGSDGLGFAIPSNLARSVMNNLIQHGKMVRGYLGVMIQDITSDLSEYFDLDEAKGTLIGEVLPDSPAERAGLKEGDIVIAVNGVNVPDKDAFRAKVAQTSPNEEISLKVIRKGKVRTVTAELEELDEEGSNDPGSSRPRGYGRDSFKNSGLNGLNVAPISNNVRREFGIPNGVKGVVVSQVDRQSSPFGNAISEGDVILSVNQKPVSSASDIQKTLQNSKGNKVLLKVLSARSGYRSSNYLIIDQK